MTDHLGVKRTFILINGRRTKCPYKNNKNKKDIKNNNENNDNNDMNVNRSDNKVIIIIMIMILQKYDDYKRVLIANLLE